jgi:hypothetical protein
MHGNATLKKIFKMLKNRNLFGFSIKKKRFIYDYINLNIRQKHTTKIKMKKYEANSYLLSF